MHCAQGHYGRRSRTHVLQLVLILLVIQFMSVQTCAQTISETAANSFSKALCKLDPAVFGQLKVLRGNHKQAYEEGLKGVASLRENKKRCTWREPWEMLRNDFLSVAISSADATLGAQAVYRAAECQEEMASYSRLARDWRLAVDLYELVARCYPASVRGDDALLNAAAICATQLRNTVKAADCLNWLLKSYGQGDMVPDARRMQDKLKAGATISYRSPAARATATAPKAIVKKQKINPYLRPDGTPFLVTIDAGHGGHDPGTIHHGVVEREVALDVALRLGRLLSDAGVRVHYTRSSDRFVGLATRSYMANRKKSDLFISIHVNANPRPDVRGLEIYYIDTRQDRLTPVTRRENGGIGQGRRIQHASVQQAAIPAGINSNRQLAAMVHSKLLHNIRRNGFESRTMGVRKGSFYVLSTTKMPSILTEIGYCTNADEAALLKRSDYRQVLAEGLAQGVLAFCSNAPDIVTAERTTRSAIR